MDVPTIRDVARRAGVATVTVSRYLNNNGPVSAEVRRRIGGAIDELGYVPNALAQGLKRRATHTLGLVVSDISNPFFTTIAHAVEEVAQAAGYSVILCNTDEDPRKQLLYLEVLQHKRVDGLLITPASDDGAAIGDWRRQCGPVCVLDRLVDALDADGCDIDVVRGDSAGAAERLVAHLLAHGHERIAVVTGPLYLSTAADRLAGYRRALRGTGLEPDPALEWSGSYSVQTGYAAARGLLTAPHPPTAIFSTSNFVDCGVLAAIRDLGMRVPEDVAVVGFDEIPQLSLVAPFLTVAAQAPDAIGRQGVELLLERLGGEKPGAAAQMAGRDIVIDTEIIIRRSCGCPGEPLLFAPPSHRQEVGASRHAGEQEEPVCVHPA